MSVKKNLTVATLLALLAVPAFSATNAHAAYNSNNGVMLSTSEARRINPITTGYGPGGRGKVESLFHGGDSEEEPSIAHYNGHTFEIPDNGGYIVSKLDGQSNPSLSEVQAALGETGGNSSANNTGMANGSTNGSQSPEYQNGNTNNGKLVQTGENDGASKAMVLGASALVASAGLMAFSFARKHKYLESVDLTSNTDTVSATNGKGNHNDAPKYSTKSSYDIIMGDTFANLSKSLKNL